MMEMGKIKHRPSNKEGKNMEHSKTQTPLKFHRFFWFVLLPLNFVSTAITLYQEFSVMEEFTWLYAVDAFFFSVSLVLMLAIIIGFFGWKSYAWYSVMGFLGLLVVSGICNVAIYAAYAPQELTFSIVQLIVAILEAVLIGKYYKNRRSLFFSDAQPTSAAPDAMYAYYDDDEDIAEDADYTEELGDEDDSPEDADNDDFAEDTADDD